MFKRLMVAGTVAVSAFAIGAPNASAATTVSFTSGNLTIVGGPLKSFTIGCVGGKLTINVVASVPPVNCAEVVAMTVRIGPSNTLATNTIDLRPMLPTAFTRLTSTFIDGNLGNDRVYGSFVGDRIDAGGKVFGLAGADVLAGNGELWGGDGDDELVGTGVVNGGRGNDKIATPSEPAAPSEVNGGDGNDTIRITTIDRAAFGGGGDDSITVIGAGGGVHPLVDGGGGADTLTPSVLRFNTFTQVDNVGVSAGSHRGLWGPGQYYVFKRIEQFAVFMDGGALNVLMQPDVSFTASLARGAVTSIDVGVPGGVWTQTATQVTAPGLGAVRWEADPDFPPSVTVHAA